MRESSEKSGQSRMNRDSGDGEDRTASKEETAVPTVTRRSFLGGTAATALPKVHTSSHSETGNQTVEWEPAPVPFDMETPWYDDVVTPETAHAQYPRPQFVREEWRNLNGVWEFTDASAIESPPTGETLDERILVPFPPESALSGIQRHENRMWHRTTFSVPEKWRVPTAHPGEGLENSPKSQRLQLHFERVDWKATVYINGEEVTTHRGGYDSFTVDITEHLNEEDEQELIVGVFDPTDTGTQPVGKQELAEDRDIFFTPSSGIWDTVWLEPVPEPHIEGLDMTPNVDKEQLELLVDAPDDTAVTATAFDDGEVVNSVTGPVNESIDLPIPDPHLWSPDDPFLYDLEIKLHTLKTGNGGHRNENQRDGGRSRGKVTDTVESYFGMRSVGKKSIRGVVRPTLNGEFVFHNGIYDQGYWPDGIYTPPTDEARRYDLQLAKDLGFNAYRKHIKIPSKRWYYWADKLGLLVWQDIPNQPLGQPAENENTQQQFRSELRDMIEQNNNHPSLAVWVPVNEGWGHGKTNYDRIRSTTRFVRELDSERLINSLSGIDTMFTEGEIEGDMLDYHNYGTLRPLPEPTDSQMSVVGESSAGWTPIDDHVWDDGDPSGDTPEILVENLVARARNTQEYMTQDGLSGAINLQTTDTEYHYQGVVTYNREVFKPELVSDDAVSRIRAENEALIEASLEIDQRPYLSVDAPISKRIGGSFDLAGTITNPEREEEGSFQATDVDLRVGDVPDGFVIERQTTTFDTISEGSSETVRWTVDVEGSLSPSIYEFPIEAAFKYEGETVRVTKTARMQIEASEPRMVGSWLFDDESSETAIDSTGDNDGTLVGDPQWVDGQVNSAFRFDGSDDFVDTGATVLDTTADYSVTAWVKIAENSGFQTAVSQATDDGSAFFLQYIGEENQFSFSFLEGRAIGGPTIETGQWYHITGVHDTFEERAKLYVNGDRVATIDQGATESSGGLFIGRATFDGNPVDFWNGTIDQVRIYQSSLDDEEVRDLYESEQ